MPVQTGTFVAVTADSSRYIQAGDAGLVYIAVCTVPR
jgi:hypothetical protein